MYTNRYLKIKKNALFLNALTVRITECRVIKYNLNFNKINYMIIFKTLFELK